MIDITTVFICIFHITFFYAVVYTIFWFSQKTYKGFGCWTLAAISNSLLYWAILLRLVFPEWVSIGAVALFMPLSAIFRADSLKRFTSGRKMSWYLYLILIFIVPINLYFYYYDNSLAIRYAFMTLLVAPFSYIVCKSLFTYKPLSNRLLYICGGVFFLMRFVGLAFEVVVLFVHKECTSIFFSPDMGAYLLFTLVAETGIGLFFFLLHAQRSHEELIRVSGLEENSEDSL